MMEIKILFLTFGIFLLVSFSFQTASSETFTCEGLTPEACKTKFGDEFEKKFKEIYLGAQEGVVEELLATYKETEEKISSEEDRTLFEKFTNELKDDLKDIQEHQDDNEKLLDIADHLYSHLHNMTELPEPLKTLVKESAEKRKTEKTVMGIKRQQLIDIEDTWEDFYKGLRPEDKEYYTRYDELNEAQLNFQEGDFDAFDAWAKALATDFGAPFFKTYVEYSAKND